MDDDGASRDVGTILFNRIICILLDINAHHVQNTLTLSVIASIIRTGIVGIYESKELETEYVATSATWVVVE